MTRVLLKSVAPSKVQTHYSLLGVPPGATVEVIHAAYRELAFKLHPDRNNGGAEQFKAIALAWGVLKQEDSRKRYDALLRLERRACKECQGKGLIQKNAGFTRIKEVPCRACAGGGYF